MAINSIIDSQNNPKEPKTIINLERPMQVPRIWTCPDEVDRVAELVRSTYPEEVASDDLKKVFHFTSYQNWTDMKKRGTISPQSTPFLHSAPNQHAQYVSDIATQNHYVVGIPPHSFDNWAESGYLQNLLNHTRRDSETRGVLLSFSIEDTEEVFFRESKYNSPRFLMKTYGTDYTRIKFAPSLKQSPELLEGYKRHIESTTSYGNYRRDFEVPEIWIPREIPLPNVKVLLLD